MLTDCDDSSTSDRNFMSSIRSVIPDFSTLNCVQQVSISIQVSLTMFAGGQHC